MWWYWRNALALSGRYGVRRVVAATGNRPVPTTVSRDYGWRDRMSTLWGDVRFGLRMLMKTPLMSLVAIVTIGTGVGLTTQMFGSLYGTSLRGLPVPDPEELVYVGRSLQQGDLVPEHLSFHTYLDVREAQTALDGVEAVYQGTVNLAGEEGPPERVQGAFITAGGLALVGVQPLLGRLFLPGEDGPGAPHRVVIGFDLWRERFASDPEVVGRRMRVNGADTEIIGVMPQGARFPFQEEVWLPMRQDPAALGRGEGNYVVGFGRLRDGVGLDVVNQELAAISARLAARFPETNEEVVVASGPYAEFWMPESITTVFWLMLLGTFGVLLIACTNVANILLARASVRTREIAVRTALGAGRWRVVRQLLIEAGVVALAGGLLGLVLNELLTAGYRDVVNGIYKPYWIRFESSTVVLFFALGVTGLAALLAGVLPALRATGIRIGETLKDESRGSSSLRMGRLTSVLVVSEIAVSCGLLVGAGFTLRSVANLNAVEYGFEAERVLVGRVGLFEADYPDAAARDRFHQDARDRLAEIPGVRSAALGTATPGLGGLRRYTSVEGRIYETDADQPVASVTAIGSGYFETLGVPFVEGRGITELEARPAGTEPVAVVTQSFARRFVGERSPLGARVKVGRAESENDWARVVGVVPDLYVGGNTGGIGNDQLTPEQVFVPLSYQGPPRFVSLHLRTDGDPGALAGALREAVASLDPNLPVYSLDRLDVAIDESNWAFGLFSGMFSLFGSAALLLAAAGLYGVMAFSVRQRTREMGVRMALGADSRSLLRLVLAKGLRQLILGLVLGLVAGAIAARALEVIMYGVGADDPLVYLATALTLGLVGLIAVLIPARSATRTDPLVAMREG